MTRKKASSKLLPRYVKRKAKQSLIYLGAFVLVIYVTHALYRSGVHLTELRASQMELSELPFMLLISLLRMVGSYFASLILAFTLGLAAARTRWGERLILPLLDILQSVPVVGFFPAAIGFFVGITHGHRLGVELAACFLIFTSQAWNLAFAVYEAVKAIPEDELDAVRSMGVSGSQKFWRLYGPASVPRLIYNSILSWSNGWFFLVACEIFSVGPIKYHLPGIGSFLAVAAENDQLRLIVAGLAALIAMILFLDFFVWRPLSAWAERFKQDIGGAVDGVARDWPYANLPQTVVARISFLKKPVSRILKTFLSPLRWSLQQMILPLFWDLPLALSKVGERWVRHQALPIARITAVSRYLSWLAWGTGALVILLAGFKVAHWLRPPWPQFISQIPLAILSSTGRLVVALTVSFAISFPIVFFCWDRPRLRQTLTTFAQLGAGVPAIALFPLVVLVVVRKFGGGMELASVFLLLTGMIWYVLFNCLGGTAVIPADLAEAVRSFGLSRWGMWKKVVFPCIRPALITGAITAWGGGWNTLVVAEYVTFRDQVMTVNGMGALLCKAVFELGDFRAIALCLFGMVAWIILVNTLIWNPIYRFTINRFRIEA